MSKVIFTSQGYFCLARSKVENNPKRFLGNITKNVWDHFRVTIPQWPWDGCHRTIKFPIVHTHLLFEIIWCIQRKKLKVQQLKGKIVSALFHTLSTFSHFPHFLHTFSTLFPHIFTLFPPGLPLKIKTSLKRIKENNKKNTKASCTLVVARLSSSNVCTGVRSHYLKAFLGNSIFALEPLPEDSLSKSRPWGLETRMLTLGCCFAPPSCR